MVLCFLYFSLMHISTLKLKEKIETFPFQVAEHLIFLNKPQDIHSILQKHSNCAVAILSFSEAENMPSYFDNIRLSWYELAANFNQGNCIDCGHFYEDINLLKDIIRILKEHKILPIILSPDALPSLEIAPFLESACEYTAPIISVISSHIPYILNYKTKAELPFHKKTLINHLWHINPKFQINAFGFQTYYIDKLVLAQMDKKGSELLRIGQVQANIQNIEHLLRGTNLLSFDIASIKHSEAPQSYFPKAIGLSAVNACQIVRYAALSNSLQVINIHGYVPPKEMSYNLDITAGVLAKMLWFIVSSNLQKSEDYPVLITHLQEHIVLCKDIEFPISFFKNKRSDKWWFAMAEWEFIEKDQHNPFLIPCSEMDYIQTKEGELPERLWKFLIKTSF